MPPVGMAQETFKFEVALDFVQGDVDRANKVIRGVALITGNLTAEGHDLEVDSTTLQQVLTCATAMKQVPVKLDHGSGVKEICGYTDNHRIDGNKVRGDWHLLKSHEGNRADAREGRAHAGLNRHERRAV